MTEGDAGVRTLGARIDDAGRRLSARHQPSLPWARGLARVYARAATSAPHLDRYERIEVAPDGPRTATLAERRLVDLGNGLGGGHRAPERSIGGAPPLTDASAVSVEATQIRLPDGGDSVESGRGVPEHLRSRLRDVVGPAADAIQVHDDGAAHALARSRNADALTIGRDVYFRDGRYRPDQASGFSLLMHEATHVQALLSPGALGRRDTRAGADAEEAAALQNEESAGGKPRSAVDVAAGSWIDSHRPPTAGQVPTMPVLTGAIRGTTGASAAPPPWAGQSTPALRPMAAAVDRVSPPPPAAPLDVDGLRRGLVDELMQRLRSEFDRGA